MHLTWYSLGHSGTLTKLTFKDTRQILRTFEMILTDSLLYDDVRNTKLIGVKVYVFKCGNNHKGRLLCPT